MFLNVHVFENILGCFLNKLTNLSRILGLFISAAIFTGSKLFSVDSKCRNTVILTTLTYTSTRTLFHDIANRGIDYGSIIARKNGQLIDHATRRRFPSLL